MLVNTARAEIVNLDDLISVLENKLAGAHLTAVLEEKPIKQNHPLLKFRNVIITPYIGSMIYQSVEWQGIVAVKNLIKLLRNSYIS